MDVIQLTQLSTKQLAAMLALRVRMEKLQRQFDTLLVTCVPKTNGHAKIKARVVGMSEKVKARLARRMRKRWREAKANGRTRLAPK